MWRLLAVALSAWLLSQFPGAMGVETVTMREWTEAWFPKSNDTQTQRPVGIRIVEASNLTVFNKNGWGGPITLGEQRIEHGIYVDALNRLHVALPKPAIRFTALVGIDNNADSRAGAGVGKGSVTFHVIVGGKELLKTAVMTLANSPAEINVPLDGATEFELKVDPVGDRSYDQSVWGKPTVEFEDGTSLLLDTLGVSQEMVSQIPFSFIYGGKHSYDLLPTWKRSVVDKKLDDKRTLRTVTYKDPATGLVCEVQVTLFNDFPAIDWVLWFRNEGDADTLVLEQVNTMDVSFPAAGNEPVALHCSAGSSCANTDFQPIGYDVTTGKPVGFGPVGGRSSNGTLPFYQVQWPGGGICVGIGWSGNWRAMVARQNGVTVETGMAGVHTVLHPGESIRLPRVLVVHWEGDDEQRGHNLYRRVCIRHYLPTIKGKPVFPIMAHPSSYDELRNSNETNQLEIIRATKKAGYEGFWLDAYWFEGYFPEGVGNWAIPIEKTIRAKDYPNGLKPIYEECEKLGLKFILWFEPERVAAGTHIDKTYPNWVLRINNGPGGLFNLGDPEARRWMTDYLSQCIKSYHLDVLRIDFNIDPLPYWHANDAADRRGMNEIRYVMGLYEMWDEILEKFPHIFIDNCASGGRRIDLETNMRSIPMWRSDYNDNNVRRGDPIADQGMTMGLAPFMPINTGPAWRTNPYYWRCASSSGPIGYWDPRKGGYSIEESKQAIAESQELQPYVLGDFFRLTANSVDPTVWIGWQYHRPSEDDGYAVFFRRDECPYSMMDTSLRAVTPEKKYEVSYYSGYDLDKREILTGKELKSLSVGIPKRRGSVLVRYKPVG